MRPHNIAVHRVEVTILFTVLALATGLPSALAQFGITYYDNFNYDTQEWVVWGGTETPLYVWDDAFRVRWGSGKTQPTEHYYSSIDELSLRHGFYSLDDSPATGGPVDEDWNPLKSINDPTAGIWYCHTFGAIFTGWVYLDAGDTLMVYSDDDVFVFLDDNTSWADKILSVPHLSYFESATYEVPAGSAGYHWMTVKFSERCPEHSGIEMTLNGSPLQAALRATVRIEPETLNLDSKGEFTAFIRLPGNHSVADIEVAAVECGGAVAVKATRANDTLIVKFNRQDLKDLTPGDEVELTVTGELADGRHFLGTDTVRVIDKGAVMSLASVAESQLLDGTFTVTYYDNYNNFTNAWDDWDYWAVPQIDRQEFWNDEYLANFTSGNTQQSAHYLPTVDTLDLRSGFESLDPHTPTPPVGFQNDDWTPLKSIGDWHWYGELSPHHVYAAAFEGMVCFQKGDVLSLESDDDSYIFLDDNTAFDQAILSDPGQHPFGAVSMIIPADLTGVHKMTVKFADTHEVQSGIRIRLNGAPLQAALCATVKIEPETLNLASKGVFTAFIHPLGNRSVADIAVSTVACAGAVAVKATRADDTLIVKFNRQDLEGVMPGDEVTLTVTGRFTDGRWFFGSDIIRVIDPGAAPKSQGK